MLFLGMLLLPTLLVRRAFLWRALFRRLSLPESASGISAVAIYI
jgi:hypothetical protein